MLNDKKIREYCEKEKMVEPFYVKKCKPASYDICVGDEYRFSHGKKIKKLGEIRKRIKIPPYSLCYVLTKETLNLPEDISANIHPRHTLVREGVLMYPQPPIDPGYKGKLYILLHNLTSKDRIIIKDEHIASIVFHKLIDRAENPYGKARDDKYQGADSLDDLGLSSEDFDPFDSALGDISNKLDKWKTGLFSKWIPILFIIITIIIAVLTAIFALLTFTNWGS